MFISAGTCPKIDTSLYVSQHESLRRVSGRQCVYLNQHIHWDENEHTECVVDLTAIEFTLLPEKRKKNKQLEVRPWHINVHTKESPASWLCHLTHILYLTHSNAMQKTLFQHSQQKSKYTHSWSQSWQEGCLTRQQPFIWRQTVEFSFWPLQEGLHTCDKRIL